MKRRMDRWSKARRSRGSVASPSEAGYLANVRPCWGEATVRFQVAPSECGDRGFELGSCGGVIGVDVEPDRLADDELDIAAQR